MGEQWSELEREMAGMKPKGVAPEVLGRLVGEMEDGGAGSASPREAGKRGAWGDWCLVGAMGSGVAAAVVIGVMLWVQAATSGPGGAGQGAGVSAGVVAAGRVPEPQQQRVGDYLAMYARADGHWDGVVK